MLETLALEIDTIQNALKTHKALLYNKDLLLNSMKSMKNLQLTSNGFVSVPPFFCRLPQPTPKSHQHHLLLFALLSLYCERKRSWDKKERTQVHVNVQLSSCHPLMLYGICHSLKDCHKSVLFLSIDRFRCNLNSPHPPVHIYSDTVFNYMIFSTVSPYPNRLTVPVSLLSNSQFLSRFRSFTDVSSPTPHWFLVCLLV